MKMETDANSEVLAEVHRLVAEARQAKSTDSAVELYEEAYKKSRILDDDAIERTCALNLGAAYIENENPQAGLDYLHKATPPDGQRSIGDLYFNKGIANEKLGKKDEALDLFEKAREQYAREFNDVMKKQSCLKMGQIFCDIATSYRVDPEKTDKAETTADKCLKLNLHDIDLEKSECSDASKILNELGLLYTQLQSYDKATQCFEKAVELCRQGGTAKREQLMAVLLQNLGAAYNFQGDYQRSIKFHEDAEKMYTKIGIYRIGRNGQGQCFMNLAYAYCQLEGGASDEAFRAFTEAKKAAIDTDDKHMLWQALEGLGAIYFNQGDFSESAEHYREAVQRVPDEENSKRVADKLEIALQYKMMQRSSGRMPKPYMQVSDQQQPLLTQQMQSMSGTQTRQIIPHTERAAPAQMQPAQQNMMSQATRLPRGKIKMRKHDSIGPHLPKVARGFGTLSHRGSSVSLLNSPRYQPTSGLDLEDSLTEKTEESESESESDDEDDDDDDDTSKVSESPKVQEIFRKSAAPVALQSPAKDATYADASFQQYANLLQQKEANEGANKRGNDDDDDDDDDDEETEDETTTDDDDDDDDDDEDDDDDDANANANANMASHAPGLPSTSPPHTALNSKDLGTYINSNPDHDSSSKQVPGNQSPRQRQSPIPTTSDIDENPYAEIRTVKRTGDDASADTSGFRVVKNGSHGDNGQDGSFLDNLPRGQREQILHEEHMKRQKEEAERTPPTLPDRRENKKEEDQKTVPDKTDDDSDTTEDSSEEGTLTDESTDDNDDDDDIIKDNSMSRRFIAARRPRGDDNFHYSNRLDVQLEMAGNQNGNVDNTTEDMTRAPVHVGGGDNDKRDVEEKTVEDTTERNAMADMTSRKVVVGGDHPGVDNYEGDDEGGTIEDGEDLTDMMSPKVVHKPALTGGNYFDNDTDEDQVKVLWGGSMTSGESRAEGSKHVGKAEERTPERRQSSDTRGTTTQSQEKKSSVCVIM